MADSTKQLRLVLVGDATSVQNALKAMDASLAQTDSAVKKTGDTLSGSQAKVSGFGSEFTKLGVAFGIGASAADIAIGAIKNLGEAGVEYAKKIQGAEATILGVTHSQEALNQAFAFADQELRAGRAAYSDTVAGIAELTPVAKRANLDVTDLYRTVQLLSTLNSGPTGGVEGAVVAINEALAGQTRSLQTRFNLPIRGIEDDVAKGVPLLQAINDALANEGVTMDLVTAKSQTASNQFNILKDTIGKLAAEVGEGPLSGLNDQLSEANRDLTDADNAAKKFGDTLGIIGTILQTHSTGGSNLFGAQGTSFIRSFYQALHDIPNDRAPDDPVEQFLQRQFKVYDDKGQELADKAKATTQKTTDAATQGLKPTPTQLSQAQGYGDSLVQAFITGASTDQIDQLSDLTKLIPDDAKPGTDAYTAAISDLAQALQEVTQTGNISETTLYKLNSVFGAQTPQVANLIILQGQLNAKRTDQQKADDAATKAEKELADAQKRAADNIKVYQQAVDDATQAQKDHRRAVQDTEDAIRDQIDAVQKEAAAAAKARQAELDGLQDGLDDLQDAAKQHAAAFQSQVDAAQQGLDALQRGADARAAANQAAAAAAQAQLTAAAQKRSNDQALLNAAIAGELEYEEQILDGLTDEEKARAAVWATEIDGQRRAKEGADDKVTDLSRQAHKEDRDALHEINDLRSSGHEKEARAAERALAERQKQRSAAMQLAQADAAVADDEFDAAQEKVKKEGQDQDVKDAQGERAAQANLTRIQAAADAQKAADDAAIKAKQDEIKQIQANADAQKVADDAAIGAQSDRITQVQKEQKAEQGRYDDRIDHLNDELTTAQTNAKAQDKIDQDRVDYAQSLLDKTKDYWDTITDGLKATADGLKTQADTMKNIADDAERAYNAEQKRYQLYKDNPPGSTGGPPLPPAKGNDPNAEPGTGFQTGVPNPPNPALNGPGAQARQAAAGLPPLLDGQQYPSAPSGYHAEYDQSGYRWYVADGHTLAEYNQLGQTTQKTTLPGSPVAGVTRMGGGGGTTVARTAGFGGEPAVTAFSTQGGQGDGAVHVGDLHFHFPNVTDIGDKDQVYQTGKDMLAIWQGIVRAGRAKRDGAS